MCLACAFNCFVVRKRQKSDTNTRRSKNGFSLNEKFRGILQSQETKANASLLDDQQRLLSKAKAFHAWFGARNPGAIAPPRHAGETDAQYTGRTGLNTLSPEFIMSTIRKNE